MKWIFPISISALFWGIVGLLRYTQEKLNKKAPFRRRKLASLIKQVAICVPAHNEELVIKKTLNRLRKLVSTKQIYVVSDGSSDQTALIARSTGCNVLELPRGVGKAAALEALMKHFRLLTRIKRRYKFTPSRLNKGKNSINGEIEILSFPKISLLDIGRPVSSYKFILIADADTIFERNFLREALPLFVDKNVAVVTAYAKTKWYKGLKFNQKMYIAAYRTRLWRLLQLVFTYGQTWKYTNVLPVIPGYASLYRVSILRQLKIDIPGLAIEDFNMSFQLHKKRLGIIAHHSNLFATTQDPATIRDYWKQLRRWNIGFFQTAKYWKIWPSFFWISLGFFIIEAIINGFAFLFIPLLAFFLSSLLIPTELIPWAASVGTLIEKYYITLIDLFVVVFLADYLLSLIIALKDKKHSLAIYGLGFIFIRFIDSMILFTTLPVAIIKKSTGIWNSPARIK